MSGVGSGVAGPSRNTCRGLPIPCAEARRRGRCWTHRHGIAGDGFRSAANDMRSPREVGALIRVLILSAPPIKETLPRALHPFARHVHLLPSTTAALPPGHAAVALVVDFAVLPICCARGSAPAMASRLPLLLLPINGRVGIGGGASASDAIGGGAMASPLTHRPSVDFAVVLVCQFQVGRPVAH